MTEVRSSFCAEPTLDRRVISQPSRDSMWVYVSLGIAVIAVLIAHRETVLEVTGAWSEFSTYHYAWIVLPTMAYLIWHHRGRFTFNASAGSAPGFIAAALCGVLLVASDAINIAEGRQFMLVASIGALALVAVGWAAFRVLAPYLALMLFMVPTGGFLIPTLKKITVSFIDGFAWLSGLPRMTDGYLITVSGEKYLVVDDCSGLDYLLTGLFIGLTMALLTFRRWWKIAVFTIYAGVLAILANGLRVIGIVAYDNVTGSKLAVSEHSYFEYPAVMISLALLLVVFYRLGTEAPATRKIPPFNRAQRSTSTRAATVFAAAALIAASPLVWRDAGVSSANAGEVASLPERITDWIQDDTTTDWAPKAAPFASRATYASGENRIFVLLAEARSNRDKLGGGGINLTTAAGWLLFQREAIEVCSSLRCFVIDRVGERLPNSERVRHIYSAFAVGADVTNSVLDFRLRRAWGQISGSPAKARLIAIAIESNGGLTSLEIGNLFEALTSPHAANSTDTLISAR